MNTAVYVIRLFLYAVAMVFYFLLGVLQFITKPGTRFIFPVVLVVLTFLFRGLPYKMCVWFAGSFIANDPRGAETTTAYVAGTVLYLFALFVLGWGYVYLSRILGLVLGVFPTMTQPLMPMRELEAPKGANMAPVAVKVAVPPLPPRQQ